MIRKIASIFLVLVIMLVIFNFSNQKGSESASLSNEVIMITVEIFTDVKRDSLEMQYYIDKYGFFVRKAAHFTIYFILGLVVMNALYICGVNRYITLYVFIICFLYAISDEVHQLFISNRSGQVSDVLLDTSGSILASYIYHRFIVLRSEYEESYR